MVRNCGFDAERQIGRQVVVLDQALHMTPSALGSNATDCDPAAGRRHDTGSWRIQCNPQAPEAPSQAAIQIDKTQMQSSANGHSYAIDCARLWHRGGGTEVRVAGPGVSEYHGSFTADLPMRCQALRLSQPETLPMAKKERVYSEDEIAARLKRELPLWHYETGWIRRKYKTHSWKGTLMVINTVGHLAEAAWHHPDITASYAWVEVRLMNHAAKGVTDKDFELARKIEDVVQWQPGKAGGALEGTPPTDQRFAYIKYDDA